MTFRFLSFLSLAVLLLQGCNLPDPHAAADPAIQKLVAEYDGIVAQETRLNELHTGKIPYNANDRWSSAQMTVVEQNLGIATVAFRDQIDLLTDRQKRGMAQVLQPHLAAPGLSYWGVPGVLRLYTAEQVIRAVRNGKAVPVPAWRSILTGRAETRDDVPPALLQAVQAALDLQIASPVVPVAQATAAHPAGL